jgi:hypothetical protein
MKTSQAVVGAKSLASTVGGPPKEGGWVGVVERAAAPLLLSIYALDVLLRATARPLWFDELISYYVARLPTTAEIWRALSHTADGQPPLSHLLMRISHLVFGPEELGTRFPAALLFGVMSWGIYVFVARRMGKAYGVTATLFAWLTWGYEYSYEARPYALLMGFCTLSFLCWRAAIEGEHRKWALAGLAFSLMALLSSHYYALLLFVPLGVGELSRTLRRKAIDWPVWAVLLTTPLCLLIYLPLALGVGTEYTQGFWSPVEYYDIYGFYLVLLAPAALPLCVALIVAGVVSRKSGGEASPVDERLFPAHEWAAVCALAATPMLYVLVTMALTGAFVYRYPLAALFGVSVLFAAVLHSWLGNRYTPVWSAAAVLALSFFVMRLGPAVAATMPPTPLDEINSTLRTIAAKEECSAGPIVVSSPLKFLALAHYAPTGLRERLVYPADPQSAREATETDSPDVSLLKLAPWADLNVPSYAEFRSASANFCVVTYSNARFDWIAGKLRDSQAGLTLVEEDGVFQMFRCCASGSGKMAGVMPTTISSEQE